MQAGTFRLTNVTTGATFNFTVTTAMVPTETNANNQDDLQA